MKVDLRIVFVIGTVFLLPFLLHAQGKKEFKGIVDEQKTADGSERNQAEWIEYFNNRGAVLASVADYYNTMKVGNGEAIKAIQGDFQVNATSFIVTSTRIKYNGGSLRGSIVHHFESKIRNPVEHETVIPIYADYVSLKDILMTNDGLEFVRALLDTKDSAGEIAQNFEKLTGKTSERIMIQTWKQEYRDKGRNEAIKIGTSELYEGSFFVDCCIPNASRYRYGSARGAR